jgi:hypothetical protein
MVDGHRATAVPRAVAFAPLFRAGAPHLVGDCAIAHAVRRLTLFAVDDGDVNPPEITKAVSCFAIESPGKFPSVDVWVLCIAVLTIQLLWLWSRPRDPPGPQLAAGHIRLLKTLRWACPASGWRSRCRRFCKPDASRIVRPWRPLRSRSRTASHYC